MLTQDPSAHTVPQDPSAHTVPQDLSAHTVPQDPSAHTAPQELSKHEEADCRALTLEVETGGVERAEATPSFLPQCWEGMERV